VGWYRQPDTEDVYMRDVYPGDDKND